MTRLRTVLLISASLLALCGVVAQAQSNKPMQTLQMPATPDPARVTLDPKTTALMVLDYVEDICQPAELQDQDAAGHDPLHGAGPQGGPHRGLRHASTEPDQMAERGRAGPGRHQDHQHGPGPVLQHRSRQGAEGEGHQDAHHGRLEDQRFGDLHIGRSDGARLHRRHSDGYDLGRQRLRDDHRLLQCLEFGQCEPAEPTLEAESRNADPHGHDHLPIGDHQQAYPVRQARRQLSRFHQAPIYPAMAARL